MSNRILPAIAAVAALAISPVASAAVIAMTSFTGLWFNELGLPTAFTNTGLDNNPQVRWGTPASGTGQSGYNLDLAPPPPTVIQTVPPNTLPFYIGKFTHVNQPITGNAITGIDLKITFDIFVDGIDTGFHNFLFHFTHDETPNGDPTVHTPCPYGGNNGQGVNINGCADAVTVSSLSASDTFLVNGVAYTLNLLGFSTQGCSGTISTQFITMEQANNDASLCASIQTRQSQVPEPGTLLLLGLGIIGLTLARRRVDRLH